MPVVPLLTRPATRLAPQLPEEAFDFFSLYAKPHTGILQKIEHDHRRPIPQEHALERDGFREGLSSHDSHFHGYARLQVIPLEVGRLFDDRVID